MSIIKNNAKKNIIFLFLFFFILSISKAFISIFVVKTIYVLPDELTFAEIARSITNNRLFGFYFGHPVGKELLYSILISIAFLFHNMFYSYDFIKLINAFFSSTIIFPLYFLAEEFLESKNALFIPILAGLLPASNAYSLAILAENIYFPLFLFAIYFLFKYEIKKTKNFAIFAGVLIGLAFLAKPTGISLFGGYLLYVVFLSIIKPYHGIYNKISGITKDFWERKLIFIISAVLILSWLIRNGFYFGFSITGMLHYHYGEASNFIDLHISYLLLGYLILEHISLMIISSGLVSFIFFLYVLWLSFRNDINYMNENAQINFQKLKKLLGIFIFPLLLLLLIASKQSELMVYTADTNRLLGRHIVVTMPLIFLIGAIGFYLFNENKNLKNLKIFTILLSLIIFFVSIFSINKYISAQAIIGSPGDLFLYIFKNSTVPILNNMHVILMASFFIKILIIVFLLSYVFFQFKYKILLKVYFLSLIIFLFIANIYAIAGSVGLSRWVNGAAKIPQYLVMSKINLRKTLISNSVLKNQVFILQMKFWKGNNYIQKNIFPKNLTVNNPLRNKNNILNIFLPRGKYRVIFQTLKRKHIFISLNKKRYPYIKNKPIIFFQHKNAIINIQIFKKYYNNYEKLIIQNINKKYYKNKIYFISNKNYFKKIVKYNKIYLSYTNGKSYFYY